MGRAPRWRGISASAGTRQFLAGIEGEYVGIRGLDPDVLHCFIDRRIAPGYIAWAFIGMHGIAQIGLACRAPVKPDLPALMAKLGRLLDLEGARLIGRRGGVIPVGGRVRNVVRRSRATGG